MKRHTGDPPKGAKGSPPCIKKYGNPPKLLERNLKGKCSVNAGPQIIEASYVYVILLTLMCLLKPKLWMSMLTSAN